MSDADLGTQVLGERGEACRGCGVPLAADQRYCLNCGRRRGEPRLDYRCHLPAESAANGNGARPPVVQASEPEPPGQPRKPQRDYAPLAAVGGIAVLGTMLLIGVLIGRGGGDPTPPPQVVRLGEGEGSEAAGAKAKSGEGDGGGAAKARAKGGKAKSAGAMAGGKGGGPVEASDQALQELQEQSPEEYRESSAKLPNEIATGGAPPPKDSKEPGGGSKGTAIE